MTDPVPDNPSTFPPGALAAPTITVSAGYVVSGVGFLPDHDVTIRVTYTAEDISDYLAYTTDPSGGFHAELPISPTSGALRIAATDYRTEPPGTQGLLWSNTETIGAPA